MSWRDVRRAAVVAVAVLAMGVGLQATPLTGSFGLIGNGVAVLKIGTENFIDFSPFADINGIGNYDITSVSGAFPYLGSDSGTIKDSSDTTPPTSPFTYFPVGVPVSINNYLTVTGYNHNFIAELLEAQTCSYVPGQTLCVGPFALSKVGSSNVAIAASVRGRIINLDTNEESVFVLSLNGTVNNRTVEQVATDAQSIGGVTLNNWSGTLDADVPEPGTLGLLLSGVGLIGIGLRRRS